MSIVHNIVGGSTRFLSTIAVTNAEPNSTVTATSGTSVFVADADENGEASISIAVAGAYTLTSSHRYSPSVISVLASGQTYNARMLSVPSEYQEVAYIQTDKTQYIRSGISPNQNYKIEFKAYPLEFANYNYLYGTNQLNQGYCCNSGADYAFSCMYGSNWFGSTPKASVVDGDEYVQDKNVLYKNGTQIATTSGASFTANEMFIFAANYNGASNKGRYKLYYLRLYNNGVAVRDFIPCYRKSDNVVGLWDRTNEQFYTKAEGNNFVAGGDVA